MRSVRRSDEEIAHSTEVFQSMPEDLEGLVAKLQDADPEARMAAVYRLMSLDDPRAVEHLIPMLQDESVRVRPAAAQALGHYEQVEAVPALLNRLANDPSPRVRSVSAAALHWMDDPSVTQALIAALADQDAFVRSMVCSILGGRRELAAADTIRHMLDDPEWQVRDSAARVLLDFGVADQRIVDAFLALKDVPEAVDTAQMLDEIDLLWKVEDANPEAGEWITEEQMDDDNFTRRDMLDVYRQHLGEEVVPAPSSDPLGDLAERARQLLSQEA